MLWTNGQFIGLDKPEVIEAMAKECHAQSKYIQSHRYANRPVFFVPRVPPYLLGITVSRPFITLLLLYLVTLNWILAPLIGSKLDVTLQANFLWNGLLNFASYASFFVQ